MKKAGLVLLFILLLGIFTISSVHLTKAVDVQESGNALNDKLDNTQAQFDNAQNQIENAQSSYLNKEWRSLLEKGPFGRFLLSVSDVLNKLNPLFKIVLQVEYGLTWAFAFAVIFWIVIFLFIKGPMKALLKSTLISLAASIIVTCIIGMTGAIRMAVNFFTSILNSMWVTIIVAILIIVLGVVFSKLGLRLRKIINDYKESVKKAKLDRDRDIIDTEAKISKVKLDAEGIKYK